MPVYTINGKRIRTDKPLSDEEIDEIASQLGTTPSAPEGPSSFKGAMDWANTPLWEGPSQAGRAISGSDTRRANFGDDFFSQLGQGITEHPWETAKGFGAGAIEGIGNWLSAQTTPLNLATLGVARGATSAARAGLPGATSALTWGARALGAPQAYEGAETAFDPSRSLTERALGGVQALGGTAQMFVGQPPVRRGGPIDFEMEDLGAPPQPPPRQAQRGFAPPPAAQKQIPDITETFPYEEYAPVPPTDPRMTSINQPPASRQFAVDESGRHLGGYIGGEPTPGRVPQYQTPPYRPNYGIIQEQARQEIGDILDEMSGVTRARQELGNVVERMVQQGMGREEIGAILQDMQRQRGLQDVGGVLDQMQNVPRTPEIVPPEPAPLPAPVEPPVMEGQLVPQQQPSLADRFKEINQRYAPAPLTEPPPPPTPLPVPTEPPVPPTLPPTPEGFADQVVPPTQEQAINQAMAPPVPPKKGRFGPRQKFTQPPKPYVSKAPTTPESTPPPPPAPPPQATSISTPPPPSGSTAPRLVGKKKPLGNAPSAVGATEDIAPTSTPETLIATNADQVEQLLSEGYKVTSRTTDGRIVMTREPDAPKSLLREAVSNVDPEKYAEVVATRKFNYGAARSKAKELGIKLDRTAKLADIHAAIKAKDPNWEPPTGKVGGKEPPTESHEWMPGGRGGGRPPNEPPRSRAGAAPEPPYEPNFTMGQGGRGDGGNVPPRPPNQPPGGPGQPPRYGPVRPPYRPPESTWRNWWNLSRGLLSVDPPWITSAAFRQGLPFIGTKYWFQAWNRARKAYSSQAIFDDFMQEIHRDELFRPQVAFRGAGSVPDIQYSIAEQLGLKFSGLEEIQQGAQLAEKIPLYGRHIKGSNRAYTTFLNHLRAWTFKRLLTDAGVWDGRNVTDVQRAKQIADFINTATGRGKLEIGLGKKNYSLEGASKILTDAMFSPRLMFSRMKMMNPSTYIQADPFVRKQYTRAMMRSIGSWWTIASLAELAGGEVSKDPNNADFGKIRIGDTRIDPGGGFQQFLVLASRLRPERDTLPIDLPLEGIEDTETGIAAIDLALGLLTAGGGGTTSSVSGLWSRYGEGYKPETRASTLQSFVASKLHPSAKMAHDIGFATERYPVGVLDRLAQMALPMMVPDIISIVNDDPTLLPVVFGASGIGMGAQTYEGGPEEPAIIPEEYDFTIGAPE